MAKVFELRIVGDTSDIEDKLKQLGFAIKEVKQGTEDIGDAAEKASNRYSGSIKKSNIFVEKLNDLTGGAVNLFLDMGDAAKKAGISIRTSLLATGIGALVVALGAAMEIYSSLEKRARKYRQEQNILRDSLVSTVSTLADFEKQVMLAESSIDLARKGVISKEEALDDYNKNLSETVGYAKDLDEAEQLLIDNTDNVIKAMQLRAQAEYLLGEAAKKRAKIMAGDKSALEENVDYWDIFKDSVVNFFKNPLGGAEGAVVGATVDEVNEAIGEVTTLSDNLEEKAKELLLKAAEIQKNINTPKKPDKNKRDKEVPFSFDYLSEQEKVQTYYDWYVGYLKEKEAELQEVRDSAANGMQELADLSEKLTDEEIARYKKEREEKEAEERGKMAITQASLDASSTAFGILGMLSEKNKELQIASIIGENATGIAKNIINTNAANARLTLETGAAAAPFIAANNIRMVTGIAASVAATVRALSELGGGGDATAGGLGTGGGAAAAPSFNLVRGTGENQLLEGITRQQDPIEAYVVSDRVTSSAALNRNRASEASLG